MVEVAGSIRSLRNVLYIQRRRFCGNYLAP